MKKIQSGNQILVPRMDELDDALVEMDHYREAFELFTQLDDRLGQGIEGQYFFEPKEFRSLIVVLEVLGNKIEELEGGVGGGNGDDDLVASLREKNPMYNRLLEQRKLCHEVIEGVVTFQHGGLNNSIDTMSDVILEYNKGREDIKVLKESLSEIKSVLMSKKSGQISLKELWMRKIEAEESLRILKDLESLKDTKVKISRLFQQKKYFNAVLTLNKSFELMFGEDLIDVTGVGQVRDDLMELKEVLLDNVVNELKDVVLYIAEDLYAKGNLNNTTNESNSDDEYDGVIAPSGDSTSNNSAAIANKSASNDVATDWKQSNFNWFDVGSKKLEEATDALEASLTEPQKAGSVFIRFLVKAIGCLNCEEDAERMLLDICGTKFRTSVLNELREKATFRRSSEISMNPSLEADVDSLMLIESQLFADHIKALLESATIALRRLLYVIRILNTWKKLKSGDTTVTYTIKDATRKAALAFWLDIEDAIVGELQVHFVEKAVQAISDFPIGTVPLEEKQQKKSDWLDTETTEKSVHSIFSPSARLAAPVYKVILAFDDAVRKILIEEGIEEPVVVQAPPVQLLPSALPKGMSILEALRLQEEVQGTFSTQMRISRVLGAVQDVLEGELVPVVQSSVNHSMREIQTNSELYFSKLDNVQPIYIQNGIPLCYAAQLCIQSARPLFKFWLQLPAHRDMIVTVLDRLIRGFASSAKDELENLTYKYISMQAAHKEAVVSAVRRDPLYSAYRHHVYGKGSIEQLLGIETESIDVKPLNLTVDDGDGDNKPKRDNALELGTWGQLWDLGATNYPMTSESFCTNYDVSTTVSSILYGCDWLSKEMCKLCVATVKSLMQEGNFNRVGSIVGSGLADENGNVEFAKVKADLQELQLSICSTVQGGCKELAKISDDAVSFLRGDLQASSFFYLHQIAHTRFSTVPDDDVMASVLPDLFGGGASKENAGNSSSEAAQEIETAISSYCKHLQGVQTSILKASTPASLAVIISPICSLAPGILMSSVKSLLARKQFGDIKNVQIVLRAIVSVQQSISELIDTSKADNVAKRRLQDIFFYGVEKARLYASILEMHYEDMKYYISENTNEFSVDEFRAVWVVKVPANQVSAFDEFWDKAVTKKKEQDRSIEALIKEKELKEKLEREEVERLEKEHLEKVRLQQEKDLREENEKKFQEEQAKKYGTAVKRTSAGNGATAAAVKPKPVNSKQTANNTSKPAASTNKGVAVTKNVAGADNQDRATVEVSDTSKSSPHSVISSFPVPVTSGLIDEIVQDKKVNSGGAIITSTSSDAAPKAPHNDIDSVHSSTPNTVPKVLKTVPKAVTPQKVVAQETKPTATSSMFSFFTGGFASSDTKVADAAKPKSTGKSENSASKAGPKTVMAPDADVKPSATKVSKPMDAKHASNPAVPEKSQVSVPIVERSRGSDHAVVAKTQSPVVEKPLGTDQPAVVVPKSNVAEQPVASTNPVVTKASSTMPLPGTASKGAVIGGVPVPTTNPFATVSVGKVKLENPFSNIAPRKSVTPAETTSNPFLITKK